MKSRNKAAILLVTFSLAVFFVFSISAPLFYQFGYRFDEGKRATYRASLNYELKRLLNASRQATIEMEVVSKSGDPLTINYTITREIEKLHVKTKLTSGGRFVEHSTAPVYSLTEPFSTYMWYQIILQLQLPNSMQLPGGLMSAFSPSEERLSMKAAYSFSAGEPLKVQVDISGQTSYRLLGKKTIKIEQNNFEAIGLKQTIRNATVSATSNIEGIGKFLLGTLDGTIEHWFAQDSGLLIRENSTLKLEFRTQLPFIVSLEGVAKSEVELISS